MNCKILSWSPEIENYILNFCKSTWNSTSISFHTQWRIIVKFHFDSPGLYNYRLPKFISSRRETSSLLFFFHANNSFPIQREPNICFLLASVRSPIIALIEGSALTEQKNVYDKRLFQVEFREFRQIGTSKSFRAHRSTPFVYNTHSRLNPIIAIRIFAMTLQYHCLYIKHTSEKSPAHRSSRTGRCPSIERVNTDYGSV